METINGREYFRREFAKYVAEVLGSEIDPESLTPVDIRALPTTRELQPPPFSPVDEPEAMGGFGKRLTAEETRARRERSERFLQMPEIHFPAEEEAA